MGDMNTSRFTSTKPHPLASVLGGLEQVGHRRWRGRCPVHGGTSPDLWVGFNAEGSTILKCRQGCSPEELAAAIKALLAKPGNPSPPGPAVDGTIPGRPGGGTPPAGMTSPPCPPDVLETIDAIRRRMGGRGGLRWFEGSRLVMDVVLRDIDQWALLLRCGDEAFVTMEEKTMHISHGNPAFQAELRSRYGFEPGGRCARMAANVLRLMALQKGKVVSRSNFSTYDPSGPSLLVAAKGGRHLRVNQDGCSLVPDGKDGVLVGITSFADPPDLKPVLPEIGRLLALMDSVAFDDSGKAPAASWTILLAWLTAILVPEAFRDRPALVLTGETQPALRLAIQVGRVFTGNDFSAIVPSGIHTLRAQALLDPLVVLDLRGCVPRWLQQELEEISHGTISRLCQVRGRLATKVHGARAWVLIVAPESAVAQSELPANTLVLTVTGPGAEPRRDWVHERGRLVGELVTIVARLLPDLANGGTASAPTTFKKFVKLVAKAVGALEEEAPDPAAFLWELRWGRRTSDLLRLLGRWIDMDGNAGRPIKTGALHSELAGLAKRLGMSYTCTSPQSLAQCLRPVEAELVRRFGMRMRGIRSRGRELVFFSTGTTHPSPNSPQP